MQTAASATSGIREILLAGLRKSIKNRSFISMGTTTLFDIYCASAVCHIFAIYYCYFCWFCYVVRWVEPTSSSVTAANPLKINRPLHRVCCLLLKTGLFELFFELIMASATVMQCLNCSLRLTPLRRRHVLSEIPNNIMDILRVWISPTPVSFTQHCLFNVVWFF